MAKETSPEKAKEMVDGWVAAGKPPYTRYATEKKYVPATLLRILRAAGHEVGNKSLGKNATPTQPQSDSNDLHQQFISSLPPEAYKQWLESEVRRLNARVKELESQKSSDR